MNPEKFDQWVQRSSTATKAHVNAYKTLFLAGGADVKVVGADLKQVDFKQVQGAGETRIAAAAGVPADHCRIVGGACRRRRTRTMRRPAARSLMGRCVRCGVMRRVARAGSLMFLRGRVCGTTIVTFRRCRRTRRTRPRFSRCRRSTISDVDQRAGISRTRSSRRSVQRLHPAQAHRPVSGAAPGAWGRRRPAIQNGNGQPALPASTS